VTLDTETHRARHIELHRSLDELLADMIQQTSCLPSKITVLELLQWSHTQTVNPTEPGEKKNQ
jgi:hypothetical protein